MIARVWKGWTTPAHADAYEQFVREQVIPELRQVAGHRGAYILRQDGPDESEFIILNYFDSLDAVRAFAGSDYTVPVIEPEARQLLAKVEPIARHYEVKVAVGDPTLLGATMGGEKA